MCPCNEKVCNYPVSACVKCIVLRIGYTHDEYAKWVIYARKIGYLRRCLISICDAKWVILRCLISTRDAKRVICARKIQVN